jgi:HSP20 family molecular chaperone IbpA
MKGLTRLTRVSFIASPLLLGFEGVERGAGKQSSDGYPPFNIECIIGEGSETLRITLAVAGFGIEDLEIFLAGAQLTINGKRSEEQDRNYLHRGIATRQFSRAFLLADGLIVERAELGDGLLTIDLMRPDPSAAVQTIKIALRNENS